MKTIAHLGLRGSFSYLAAVKSSGQDNHFVSAKTFREVFQRLEDGEADYAAVPIENSLVGSIYENYDLLEQHQFTIVEEHFLKVDHCLLGMPHATLKDVKTVFSHPKALEQCLAFFEKHPWMQGIAHSDTAAAAASVSASGDPAYAAIASASAGEIYGLSGLQRGIEDDPSNYTRFVIVSKERVVVPGASKCSLSLRLEHVPGALAAVLNRFSSQGFNLMKMESRPLRGQPFEYVFYVDFEFTDDMTQCGHAELATLGQTIRILGLYKAGILWKT